MHRPSIRIDGLCAAFGKSLEVYRRDDIGLSLDANKRWRRQAQVRGRKPARAPSRMRTSVSDSGLSADEGEVVGRDGYGRLRGW